MRPYELKTWISSHKMPIGTLAEALGVSRQSLSAWLHGRTRIPAHVPGRLAQLGATRTPAAPAQYERLVAQACEARDAGRLGDADALLQMAKVHAPIRAYPHLYVSYNTRPDCYAWDGVGRQKTLRRMPSHPGHARTGPDGGTYDALLVELDFCTPSAGSTPGDAYVQTPID